ncbi:WD40/YVTN/BNR-like repeat-containing protein, partial [Bacteroidota bacterium]
VSDDAGTNWTKIEIFAEVPETTYVSDVFASAHDENVVYATFNNHKRNDYKPYVLKSTDKGQTWSSINGNLPDDEPIWTIYEDHENPNLLFAGTEFSLYFTIDGGTKWIKLNSGLPPIAVRDLEIQKKENDLIVGTFGRGIYILDDFSPLREVSKETFEKDFHIFPIKDALMFNQSSSKQKSAQGEDFFRVKNPEYGAVFTYYLKEGFKTKKDTRKEKEKEIEKEKKPYTYPTWDKLRAEDLEEGAYLIFEISDAAGNQVRRQIESPKKGINRINWDLCYASKSPISKKTKTDKHSDFHVMPGKYNVTTYKSINGKIEKLSEPVEFIVKRLKNSILPAEDEKALVAFQSKLSKLQQAILGTDKFIAEANERIDLVKVALQNTPEAPQELLEQVRDFELRLGEIKVKLNGDPSLSKRNANQPPSIKDRMWHIVYSTSWSSSAPTQTAKQAYSIIAEEFVPELDKLRKLINIDLDAIEKKLQKMDAPWTPGRIPYWKPE